MSGDRIRVFVADDHPLVREGISAAVRERPAFELVGAASDGRQTLEEIRRLQPDVALLDVKMPGLDGRQVVRTLAQEGSATRVVFISAYLDRQLAYEALACGAAGFLSKLADRRSVCEAIEAAARGETVLAPEIQGAIAEQIRLQSADDDPGLSAREREVLALIAEGLSAPEIGERLHLSPSTVKGYMQQLYEKLDVSDRAAAVAQGMRRGILS